MSCVGAEKLKKVKKSSSAASQKGKLLDETKKILMKEGAMGLKIAQEALSERRIGNEALKEAIGYTCASMNKPADYFRPALLSLCSKAVGGMSEVTFPIAASLVLFGRAIGIHDDIIDQSKRKNRRLTVPGKLGEDMAIILSDVLLFKGFTMMRKALEMGVPAEKLAHVLSTVERIWFEQSEGEALEIQSRSKTDISPEKCLAKIEMRASELEACTRIGAILGGGSRSEIESLGKYGRRLGFASILRNELIDMLELKTLRHRIRNESLPLPIVYALHNPQFRAELTRLISERRSTKNVATISRVVDQAGGIEQVANLMGRIVEEAHSYLDILKNKEASSSLRLLLTTLPVQPEEWKPILYEKS